MKVMKYKKLFFLALISFNLFTMDHPKKQDPFTLMPTEIFETLSSLILQSKSLEETIKGFRAWSQISSTWRNLFNSEIVTKNLIEKLHKRFPNYTKEEITRKLLPLSLRKELITASEKGCIPYMQIVVNCITNNSANSQTLILGNNKSVTLSAGESKCINETIYSKFTTCTPIALTIVKQPESLKLHFSKPVKTNADKKITPYITGKVQIVLEPFKLMPEEIITFTVNLTIEEKEEQGWIFSAIKRTITPDITQQTLKAPFKIQEKYSPNN